MLALAAVWAAMVSLFLSLLMLVYRPAFTDPTVTVVLWFGVPGALCFAGLTLWAHRDEGSDDLGVVARRIQAKIAIVLGILAAGIVYALIIFSTKLDPVEQTSKSRYTTPYAAIAIGKSAPTLSQGVPMAVLSLWESPSCACG